MKKIVDFSAWIHFYADFENLVHTAHLLPVISEHARVGARPHLFIVSLHQDDLAIVLSWAKSFMEIGQMF